jgi:hypothetical protein
MFNRWNLTLLASIQCNSFHKRGIPFKPFLVLKYHVQNLGMGYKGLNIQMGVPIVQLSTNAFIINSV